MNLSSQISFGELVNKQINVNEGFKKPNQPRGSNEQYKLVGYAQSQPHSYEYGVKPADMFIYLDKTREEPDFDLIIQPQEKGKPPFVFDKVSQMGGLIYSRLEKCSKQLGINDRSRLGNDVTDMLKTVSKESNIKMGSERKIDKLFKEIQEMLRR